MKKTSIKQIYIFSMISHMVALICSIVGIILLILYSKELMGYVGRIAGLVFVICIIAAFAFLIALSLKKIIALLRDYQALKNKQYVSIIGKVIGFKKNREPESGVQINDKPIIKLSGTSEEIVLNINDRIVVGETYKFNYLKNSKIAEIIEIINTI